MQRCEQNGPYLPANQSPRFLHVGHLTCAGALTFKSKSAPDFCAYGFQIRCDADGGGALDGADFEDGLRVFNGFIELQ